MKALTIWQPWASLILGTVPLSETAKRQGLTLPKDIENRHWITKYRGDLLIHAGKRIDTEWMWIVPPGWQPPTGALIGVVRLYGIHNDSDSVWAADGQFHWHLSNPRAFRKVIPYAGSQGLFEVPNATVYNAFLELEEPKP